MLFPLTLDPTLLIPLADLYWPEFIQQDGFVFLKENFTSLEPATYQTILKDPNPEYWVNLFLVDPFFPENSDPETNDRILSQKLASIWTVKLKNEFPEKVFVVKEIHDSSVCDYGLTFYQKTFTSQRPD